MTHHIGARWPLNAVVIAIGSVLFQSSPEHGTFRPIKDDPVAASAHSRLFAARPLISFIEQFGSDARIKSTTRFVSEELRKRLSQCEWPEKSPSFTFAPDLNPKDAHFDLADAYAYAFIAHIDLAYPDFGEIRQSLRPWPVAKIRRQFQRALTSAGELSQLEKERLYFALARSASIAQAWWYEIEMAINARGDVVGNSWNDADFVTHWLLGLRVQQVETENLRSGVQRKLGHGSASFQP